MTLQNNGVRVIGKKQSRPLINAISVDIITRNSKKCFINHETQEGLAKFDELILHLSYPIVITSAKNKAYFNL